MIRNIFLTVVFIAFALVGLNAQNYDIIYIMKDGNIVNRYNVNTEIDSIIFYNDIGEYETMYIMKNGSVVGQYNVNNDMDSIIFYQPTLPENTFIDDRDGNVYRYVTIGNQTWMADNLRYLPSVTDSTEVLDVPAYYVYRYGGTDVAEAKAHPNYTKFGVLYNWYAAMDGASASDTNPSGVRGVCPEGWHLPSNAEWTELTGAIGDASVVGGKLKETGTEYWKSPNSGATNEYEFNARGGGLHARIVGKFLDLKEIGYWWTTSTHEMFTGAPYVRFMWYDKASISEQYYDKPYGFSVRCVKD